MSENGDNKSLLIFAIVAVVAIVAIVALVLVYHSPAASPQGWKQPVAYAKSAPVDGAPEGGANVAGEGFLWTE